MGSGKGAPQAQDCGKAQTILIEPTQAGDLGSSKYNGPSVPSTVRNTRRV
eukprot:m.149717 g.149717  ORF g.149717 m.149717 type:complete len:50 (-) comp15017_c0_seq18:2091-2240(-)